MVVFSREREVEREVERGAERERQERTRERDERRDDETTRRRGRSRRQNDDAAVKNPKNQHDGMTNCVRVYSKASESGQYFNFSIYITASEPEAKADELTRQRQYVVSRYRSVFSFLYSRNPSPPGRRVEGEEKEGRRTYSGTRMRAQACRV